MKEVPITEDSTFLTGKSRQMVTEGCGYNLGFHFPNRMKGRQMVMKECGWL